MTAPPNRATWQQLQGLVQRLQRLHAATLRAQFALAVSVDTNADPAALEAHVRELQSNAASVIASLKELGAKPT